MLLTEDESRHALDTEHFYVVQPDHAFWAQNGSAEKIKSKPLAANFRYASDNNTDWLTPEQLRDYAESKPSAVPVPVAL